MPFVFLSEIMDVEQISWVAVKLIKLIKKSPISVKSLLTQFTDNIR